MKKIIQKTGILALLLCTMLMVSTRVLAADAPQAVKDAQNGVFAVQFCYEDRDTKLIVPIYSGTGFLINEDHFLTCAHVVTLTEEDKEAYYDAFKIIWGEAFATRFAEDYATNMKVRICIGSDVYVYATLVNGSQNVDWAVYQLDTTVSGKYVVPLGDSDLAEVGNEVFALGFPGITTDEINKANTYTMKDVNLTTGNIQKITNDGGTNQIQHGAELSSGNSGGPLLNASGEVIGLNQSVMTGDTANYYYSISINKIKEILDTLGIGYTSGSGAMPQPAETAETESNFEETTAAPTEKPTIPKTDKEDKSEDNTMLIVGIAAGAVVLIIIIIVIIILATRGKGNNKGNGNGPQGPTSAPHPFPPVQPQMGQQPQMRPQQPQFSEGSNETTVLNEGGGETTVLGGQPTATLLRIKNGEKITINRPEFSLGKERRRVDYCISDNNSVSRCHAKVVTRGGQHFIIDMNSTNFTYVNGAKIAPNQEKALANGDKIKISDEEFEFRTF